MKNILFAVAALATFGVSAANAADGRDQSLNSNVPAIVEGRNAAVVTTSTSDAYIAQSVAQDARSTR